MTLPQKWLQLIVESSFGQFGALNECFFFFFICLLVCLFVISYMQSSLPNQVKYWYIFNEINMVAATKQKKNNIKSI